MSGKTVGIVGLGLIGGSLAKGLRARAGCRVLGLDIDPQVMEAAQADGGIDGPLEDYSQLDLLIVALFPEATVAHIRQVVAQLRPGAVVMDICGVKKSVADGVAQLCKSHGVEFLGAHPMAGKACWGYQNADGNLFEGASMILTPVFTDDWAVQMVQGLCQQLGFARVVFTDPQSHDKMIGYTSQLAHILSSAYIKNPLCMNYKGYTGGSFQDLTRVARLNPVMWRELFLLNRQNLLEDLDLLIQSLNEYRRAIADGDGAQLEALLADGARIKEELMRTQPEGAREMKQVQR